MVHVKTGLKGIGLLIMLLLIDTIVQSIYFGLVTVKSNIGMIVFAAVLMLVALFGMMYPVIKRLRRTSSIYELRPITMVDVSHTLTYVIIILLGNYLITYAHVLFNGRPAKIADNQATLNTFVTPHMVLGLVILVLIVAPIIEEVMFRGVLINMVLGQFSFWTKVVVSGFAFGLFHVIGTSFQLTALLEYSFMGMVLGYAFLKTNRLQSSMMLHFTNNFIAVVPMVATLFQH